MHFASVTTASCRSDSSWDGDGERRPRSFYYRCIASEERRGRTKRCGQSRRAVRSARVLSEAQRSGVVRDNVTWRSHLEHGSQVREPDALSRARRAVRVEEGPRQELGGRGRASRLRVLSHGRRRHGRYSLSFLSFSPAQLSTIIDFVFATFTTAFVPFLAVIPHEIAILSSSSDPNV